MEKESAIRVVLVDDHAVVRTGLTLIIEKHDDLRVIGEAATREEALALVVAEQPDIILLDLDLGEDSGLKMIPELAESAPESRIIALTGLRDPKILRDAVKLGAMGIVKKEEAASDIIQAIREVEKGSAWLDRSMMGQVLSDIVAPKTKKDPEMDRIATLTDREREVVGLVGEGLKSKDVAERLFISETTVRHHLTSIFSKLEVSDRVELMLFSYRNGLAKAPPLKQ
jgi:DNA-binding NarL/FixJ family response regulator